MKSTYLKCFMPCALIALVLTGTACTEKWSEHYDPGSFNLPDKTLTGHIRENPGLSTFSGMLNISGYDQLLDASQSFTVWAPNNAALAGLDTTNTDLVLDIVRNHIARSRYTTSGVDQQAIRMLNGKFIHFSREAAGYTFGNSNVLEVNTPAVNGLLHVIDGYAPYQNNLWEFIGKEEALDSLRTYLYGQSKNIFDPVNSVEIGVNEDGQAVYDTVFIFSNPVLDVIGAIDDEDSIYTAIIPDNTAWIEAYGRIEPYFNFPDDAGGRERQREESQFTLVQDMLFEGIVAAPSNLDSLVSTTGTVFDNPGSLFSNTEQVPLSNGLAHVTSRMPYSDTDSWFREIRVEAEDPEGRINVNSNIFPRSSYGSGLDVSENSYILVDPTSADPSVEFPIPNTLSAKYNIYCVFVPPSIVNPLDFTPTKARFVLTYIRRTSGSTFVSRITPEDNATLPFGMTKMLVTQFDFEFANVITDEFDRIAVKLEVINDVTAVEEQSGEFSRTMRIDCIILEPVLE